MLAKSSRHSQVIRWNLADNTFERGQFVKARAYVLSISPDGKYFTYQAVAHHREQSSYLALAKPPYFSALAFWPTDSLHTWSDEFQPDGSCQVGTRSIEAEYAGIRIEPGCPFLITSTSAPGEFLRALKKKLERLGDIVKGVPSAADSQLVAMSKLATEPRTGIRYRTDRDVLEFCLPDSTEWNVLAQFEYEPFREVPPPDWALVW